MAHHVYTTDGVVLLMRPTREADKTAYILTRDLGLVSGTARGIRKEASRLRHNLIELAFVKVSLVKTLRGWRITTVTLQRDVYADLRGNKEAVKSVHRVLALILKLVHGEDKNTALFDELESSLSMLLDKNHVTPNVADWETFTVARLLSHLGYLSKDEAPENMEKVKSKRKQIIALINNGIRESGLYNV